MIIRAAITALALFAVPATAQSIDAVIEGHILPSYARLANDTQALSDAATASCLPGDPALTTAYHAAFDAWVKVSHLRFGPSEVNDRAFALAFWPDSRGATPKTLATLIRGADPVIDTLESFQTVSIAARGFYALEFLLFDEGFADLGTADYRCALIRVSTADIAANAAAILTDWENGHGDLMREAGSNDTYRSAEEAQRQLFTALTTGLEFTSAMRLGRPLGTFDRPRPKRAEARRSGRSLRHVILSLEATRQLAALISEGDTTLDGLFEQALGRAAALDDPVFAGVSDIQGRLRVEALQQSVDRIDTYALQTVGPRLGISAGFNALDGD
ncbi:imelysin family protein [Roseovarius sp. 2305UL8-3]|uniref:imelysin family protein n=1 Tax=Roseovarius conchicola TaxID=3121636 RepID=UPI003527E14B